MTASRIFCAEDPAAAGFPNAERPGACDVQAPGLSVRMRSEREALPPGRSGGRRSIRPPRPAIPRPRHKSASRTP